MQPPGKGVKKVYIFGLGHMSKMATMLIYGINFSRTTGSIALKLGMWHQVWHVATGELVL